MGQHSAKINYTNNMEISQKIAITSLLFSLIALIWNIVRDIFIDRIKLSVHVFIGGEITDERGRQIVASAGSTISVLGVEQTVRAKKVFFRITNIGRRDIEIDCIKAKYIDGTGWYLPINEKRYLKPYESTNANTENSELQRNLKSQKVKSIYVEDTKGIKWNFPDRDIEKARLVAG